MLEFHTTDNHNP